MLVWILQRALEVLQGHVSAQSLCQVSASRRNQPAQRSAHKQRPRRVTRDRHTHGYQTRPWASGRSGARALPLSLSLSLARGRRRLSQSGALAAQRCAAAAAPACAPAAPATAAAVPSARNGCSPSSSARPPAPAQHRLPPFRRCSARRIHGYARLLSLLRVHLALPVSGSVHPRARGRVRRARHQHSARRDTAAQGLLRPSLSDPLHSFAFSSLLARPERRARRWPAV